MAKSIVSKLAAETRVVGCSDMIVSVLCSVYIRMKKMDIETRFVSTTLVEAKSEEETLPLYIHT